MPRMMTTPREIPRFLRQECGWSPARHGILWVTCVCKLKNWMPKHSKKIVVCRGRAQSWWKPSWVWEARAECRWHKAVAKKMLRHPVSPTGVLLSCPKTKSSHPQKQPSQEPVIQGAAIPRRSHLKEQPSQEAVIVIKYYYYWNNYKKIYNKIFI